MGYPLRFVRSTPYTCGMTERSSHGEFDALPEPGPDQDGVVFVNALGFAFECKVEHDVLVEGDSVWVWEVTGLGPTDAGKEIL